MLHRVVEQEVQGNMCKSKIVLVTHTNMPLHMHNENHFDNARKFNWKKQ